MNTIELKCERCGNTFKRNIKEYKRNKERNQRICCSRSCTAFLRNASMTDEYWKEQYEKQKNTFDIKSQSGNRLDEYSPFRLYLRKGRASIKKHKDEIDIDEKYLKELWEKQNGICPYTGIKMVLMKTSSQQHRIRSLKKASIDRIDSSKGYLKGNVEFVCYAINNAKNNFSKKEMKNFISEIKNTNF